VKRDVLPGFEQVVHVNIFNISKINSEVRGGKSPRIKRLSERVLSVTEHSAKTGGKPWKYLLIPHDAIAENMSIVGLAAQFSVN
jgi:hypothetical protein